jgi:hypothetical protein
MTMTSAAGGSTDPAPPVPFDPELAVNGFLASLKEA